MIKLIKTIEEVEAIRVDWQELMCNSCSCTPFQSVDYIIAAWRTMDVRGCDLFVVCYYQQKDNILQAIFPWYIDDKHTLRYINDIHTDFCNIILRTGVETEYHFWEEMTSFIKQESRIKHICLENLKSDLNILAYFRYFLHASVIYCNNSFSVLKIAKQSIDQSFIYSLQLSNSTERNRIKKVWNKALQSEFSMFHFPMQYPENIIEGLMNSMVKNKIRKESYFAQIRSLIRNLYDSGLLLVCVTTQNDNPLACNLFLTNNSNEYLNWLVFYVDKQYNLWNILQSIDYISNRGGHLNFCRGTYEYKMRNFRPSLYNLYTLRWSKSFFGQMEDIWTMNMYQLRQVAKKIIRG